MRLPRLISVASLSPFIFAFGICASTGCEDKETVLDVETPSGQVEVERDRGTGEVDVEATDSE
jgi:hypothetical protein